MTEKTYREVCDCTEADTCPQGHLGAIPRCAIIRHVQDGSKMTQDALNSDERNFLERLRPMIEKARGPQLLAMYDTRELLKIIDRLAPRPRSNEERLRNALETILERGDVPTTMRGFIIGELNATAGEV